ncbi:hypothetical protein EVAR_29802_1 [Eumeta japonica]|uniref:Uncharacterized protein n=1 Tax=Eumeta variegata TaxID=151549 RepID=A0A4C1XNS3_EUMVA|nr:hypothetical protein EVAR_29802_1 [Eumeta japonica]
MGGENDIEGVENSCRSSQSGSYLLNRLLSAVHENNRRASEAPPIRRDNERSDSKLLLLNLMRIKSNWNDSKQQRPRVVKRAWMPSSLVAVPALPAAVDGSTSPGACRPRCATPHARCSPRRPRPSPHTSCTPLCAPHDDPCLYRPSCAVPMFGAPPSPLADPAPLEIPWASISTISDPNEDNFIDVLLSSLSLDGGGESGELGELGEIISGGDAEARSPSAPSLAVASAPGGPVARARAPAPRAPHPE